MTQQQIIDNSESVIGQRRIEDALDCIAIMRLQEESDAYRRVDYVASLDSQISKSSDQTLSAHVEDTTQPQRKISKRPVDAECRRKMSDWSYKIVDYCGFDRETVSVAMSYLDRFLSTAASNSRSSSSHSRATQCLSSRREYQLASMTSLYVAVKLHEPLLMDPEHISALSRGSYSVEEVVNMERDILEALEWRTSDPTPLGFYSRFLALLPESAKAQEEDEEESDEDDESSSAVEEALMDMGRAQTELITAEYDLIMHNPSTMAAAALMNALEAIAGVGLLTPAEMAEFLESVAAAAAKIDLRGDEEVARLQSRLRGLLVDSGSDIGATTTSSSCQDEASEAGSASTAEETACSSDSDESESESDDSESVSEPQPKAAMVEDEVQTPPASPTKRRCPCVVEETTTQQGQQQKKRDVTPYKSTEDKLSSVGTTSHLRSSLATACSWAWGFRQNAKVLSVL